MPVILSTTEFVQQLYNYGYECSWLKVRGITALYNQLDSSKALTYKGSGFLRVMCTINTVIVNTKNDELYWITFSLAELST